MSIFQFYIKQALFFVLIYAKHNMCFILKHSWIGFWQPALFFSCLFLTVCPPGTYKPEATPGGLSTCLSCPDTQHTSQPGSTSLDDCVCKPGYQPIGMTCQGKRNLAFTQIISYMQLLIYFDTLRRHSSSAVLKTENTNGFIKRNQFILQRK